MLDEEPTQSTKEIPDFVTPQYGFYHTVDSALVSLRRLAVTPDHITIRKVGPGWEAVRIVQQQGTPDAMIALDVEGNGFFEALPAGMHEGTKEGEIGTRELASLFDDALEKAAHFVRQGGLFFDVRPDNPAGCARWIKVFGIEPTNWPETRWYALAILLPCLRYLAGREAGFLLALRLLLDISVAAIKWQPRATLLCRDDQSKLGARASRLGVDFVVGTGMEDEAECEIILGPVSLATYRWFQTAEGQERLAQTLRLVTPYHWAYRIGWFVGERNQAPRLGKELNNAVLGVNSHLGNL